MEDQKVIEGIWQEIRAEFKKMQKDVLAGFSKVEKEIKAMKGIYSSSRKAKTEKDIPEGSTGGRVDILQYETTVEEFFEELSEEVCQAEDVVGIDEDIPESITGRRMDTLQKIETVIEDLSDDMAEIDEDIPESLIGRRVDRLQQVGTIFNDLSEEVMALEIGVIEKSVSFQLVLGKELKKILWIISRLDWQKEGLYNAKLRMYSQIQLMQFIFQFAKKGMG